MAKQKYNPDDIERWVTIKGARIPIMKDGTMGIGVKESITRKDVEELTAKKDALKGVKLNTNPITQEEINQWKQNNPFKTTSRNARYDTSRATTNKGKKTQSLGERLREKRRAVGYNDAIEYLTNIKGATFEEHYSFSGTSYSMQSKYEKSDTFAHLEPIFVNSASAPNVRKYLVDNGWVKTTEGRTTTYSKKKKK